MRLGTKVVLAETGGRLRSVCVVDETEENGGRLSTGQPSGYPKVFSMPPLGERDYKLVRYV